MPFEEKIMSAIEVYMEFNTTADVIT